MNEHGKGNHKTIFRLFCVIFTVVLSIQLATPAGAVYAQDNEPPATIQDSEYLKVRTFTTADGTSLTDTIIGGPPTPPVGYEDQRAPVTPTVSATIKNLSVPTFTWVHGCSAVSGAMIAGFYDNNGYPNMYTGPTNGGVMPMTDNSWPTWVDGAGQTYPNNPLIASHQGVDGLTTRGSIDDYWVEYGSTAQDPYMTGGWSQHSWGTAIGDYMKTSEYAYNNTDGSTHFYNYTSSADKLTCSAMVTAGISTLDGTYGRKLFYEARGYTVTDCYNQKTDNTIAGGFSLANFKAQIDANRPVLLNLAGHSIVGVGYDSASSTIYIHDTWDESDHTMTWGGSYSGMQLLSVSVVNLASSNTTVPTPQAPSGTITDTTPTYKWTKITGATQYRYELWKGTTKVYTQTVASSACGTSTCSNTPATVLGYAAYKWRAQAYVGGAWKSYSAYKNFTVAAPTSGFNSQFTTDAAGWTPVKGSWSVSGGSYQSPGVADYFASSKHSNIYNKLTYTVKIQRSGCTMCSNGLWFNGTPAPLGSGARWNKGYALWIWPGSNEYSVWRYDGGVATSLVPWTTHSAVHASGWNVLKVTYNSSNGFVQFFINGTRVVYGTFLSYKSGQVGVGFYRDVSSTGNRFYVDYATLSASAPTADAASGGIFVSDTMDSAVPADSDMMAP